MLFIKMTAFLADPACLDAATEPMHSSNSSSSSSSSMGGSGGQDGASASGATALAAAGLGSDTLLHVLLRLRLLQLCALAAAVDALLALSSQQQQHLQQRGETEGGAVGSRDYQICLRVLGHIRWCEAVFEPWDVLSALMQAAQALPPPLQIEVIALVPGLSVQCDLAPGGRGGEAQLLLPATDSSAGSSGVHALGGGSSGALALSSQLLDMAESNVDLLAAVLDAVSHLAVSCAARREVMAMAQQFAADSLSALHSSQLPAVARFLLETADGAEAAREVLGVLRAKLGDFLSATKFSGILMLRRIDRMPHKL
jgi:hypothetical protein